MTSFARSVPGHLGTIPPRVCRVRDGRRCKIEILGAAIEAATRHDKPVVDSHGSPEEGVHAPRVGQ